MKRVIPAILILMLLLPVSVFAQSNQGQADQLDRYYVGIGVQLFEVHDRTEGFNARRNGKDIRFDNKNGVFTGAVFLGRVLENGPADKAGLEDADILLEVDGESIQNLGITGVIGKITSKSVGDSVDLRVRQTDEGGNVLREFNASIDTETIDRASWVHLDMELGGYYCAGDECVSYTTKVSEDKTIGKFIYRFGFFNQSSEPVILDSSVVGFLFRKSNSDRTRDLLRLNPMKTTTIVLESGDFPSELTPGLLRIFRPLAGDRLEWVDYEFLDEDDFYVDSAGKKWVLTTGATFSLFVPYRWHLSLIEEIQEFSSRP